MAEKNDVTFSLRLPQAVYDRLKALAERNKRSTNAQVQVFIEEGLAAEEKVRA